MDGGGVFALSVILTWLTNVILLMLNKEKAEMVANIWYCKKYQNVA